LGASAHEPQGNTLNSPAEPVTATDELAELVARARTGDRRAFDDLVTATYPEAFTLASRLMGNEDDASDVVQDAYLRAFRAIGRFRGDARFTTWLYRIVANCAATALGRRGRHRHEDLDDGVVVVDDHPDHDPQRKASAAYDRARVTAALAALPEKLRVVVVLRDVYDLPHEAIAAELGITETAAKVRLHRARKKLRVRLSPLHHDVDIDIDIDIKGTGSGDAGEACGAV